MTYEARVVADSVSPQGVRITTVVVTLPRIVLAELNTHRVFSRNSASSRAIPIQRQLERIQYEPFVPDYWGKNQSGMQAPTELEGEARQQAQAEWLSARDGAVTHVQRLLELGLHKQTTNRLIEAFMWHTVVITATEWSNFFALRINPQAQPEIRKAAEAILSAIDASSPSIVSEGEWHLPFIQDDERNGAWEYTEEAARVSAARCARVSYLTHDGRRDHVADLQLYERLVTSGHMSPLEHVATPFTTTEVEVRRHLAAAARGMGEEAGLDQQAIDQIATATAFNGNFRGWTQLRKRLWGESDFSLLGEG